MPEFDSFDEDLTLVGAPAFAAYGTGDYIESATISRDRGGFLTGWQMALNARFGSGSGFLASFRRTGPETGSQSTRQITFIPSVTGVDTTPAQFNSPINFSIPFAQASVIPLNTVVVVLCRDLLVADFVTPANFGGTLDWTISQLPFKWEVIRTNIAAPNDVFTIWDASINPAGPVPNDALFSASTTPTGHFPPNSFQTNHALRASYFLGRMFYFRFTTAFANQFELGGGDFNFFLYPESDPQIDA